MDRRGLVERGGFLLFSLLVVIGTALPSLSASPTKEAAEETELPVEMEPLPETNADTTDNPEVTGQLLLRVDYQARTHPTAGLLTVYPSPEGGPLELAGGTLIPQALTNLLLDAMAEGWEAERETLSALLDDRELSQEEFLELTGYESEYLERVSAVLIDGDDDGIPDIAADMYFGGSGGFTAFTFFKGQGDGTYRRTSAFSSVIQEFGFVQYEGRHYLVRTSCDYNTNEVDGLDVYCYRDGQVADARWLYFAIEGYDCAEELLAPEGEAALAALDQVADVPGRIGSDGVVTGTAETVEPLGERNHIWHCDLDNDGVEERYQKHMWYPTNISTVQNGWVEFQEDRDFPALEEMIQEICGSNGELRYYTFWVDQVHGQNVTYLGFWRPDGYTVYACRFQRNIEQE